MPPPSSTGTPVLEPEPNDQIKRSVGVEVPRCAERARSRLLPCGAWAHEELMASQQESSPWSRTMRKQRSELARHPMIPFLGDLSEISNFHPFTVRIDSDEGFGRRSCARVQIILWHTPSGK